MRQFPDGTASLGWDDQVLHVFRRKEDHETSSFVKEQVLSVLGTYEICHVNPAEVTKPFLS